MRSSAIYANAAPGSTPFVFSASGFTQALGQRSSVILKLYSGCEDGYFYFGRPFSQGRNVCAHLEDDAKPPVFDGPGRISGQALAGADHRRSERGLFARGGKPAVRPVRRNGALNHQEEMVVHEAG